MTVAFRNATSHEINASSNVCSVPSGVVNGDLMLAFVLVSGGAHLPSTPAGWTALDNEVTGPSVQTYWRIAASEPANYTFSPPSSLATSVIIAAYSGADGTTPVHKHGTFHRSTSTTTVTADSVTPTINGCMIVFCGGVGQATTFTGPTSYNQRTSTNGDGIANILADFFQSTAGAVGSITATAGISGTTQGSLLAIAPPSASPPTNTVAPAVTGTATVGSVLTTTNGTWTDAGSPAFTYQWQRGGVNIGSATSSTYTLVDADDATNVRCVVTDTDANGATAANSNAVAILEPVPTNSVLPVVTGTTNLGDTLTSTTGTWANQGGTVATYAYQWQRDDVNIGAATASTRVIASADQGHNLRCVVTATNSGGAGSPANSLETAIPAAAASSSGVVRAGSESFLLIINSDY